MSDWSLRDAVPFVPFVPKGRPARAFGTIGTIGTGAVGASKAFARASHLLIPATTHGRVHFVVPGRAARHSSRAGELLPDEAGLHESSASGAHRARVAKRSADL